MIASLAPNEFNHGARITPILGGWRCCADSDKWIQSTRGENPGGLLAVIHRHEASKHQKIIRVNLCPSLFEVWLANP